MTPPEIVADLRRLAEDFRALGLADYARGRADLAALLWACATDLEEAPMPTLPTGHVRASATKTDKESDHE